MAKGDTRGDGSINAVLIVRDEARCVARAIESVRELVDEVIVVDTGSTDRTAAIAKTAGARVHFWAWRDDFAAARNHALQLSGAAVNLILDADEWLAEPFTIARQFRTDAVGLAKVVSTSVADGLPVESTTVSERLLPAGVRYRGAVHEQPHHSLPTYACGLTLRHDGYEPAQVAAKVGRNETILRRQLAESGADAYLLYQLGKDLQAQERYAESAASYAAALATGVPDDAPWRHALVVRAISVFGKSGDFEAAIALADQEGPSWDRSPDYHFALGNMLLDLGIADPTAAEEVLPLVEASWLRCLEIGERPDLPGSVAGRGSALAAHNLAGYYESVGRSAEAAKMRKLSGIKAARQ